MRQKRIRARSDLDRRCQENHDYCDIIQGTRTLSTLQQSLMHVFQVVWKYKIAFVRIFLRYFGINYDYVLCPISSLSDKLQIILSRRYLYYSERYLLNKVI